MDIRRKCFAAMLALVMLLSMAGTVSAAESEDATKCIQQILNYRYHHGDAAKTDVACLLYQLEEIDPASAQLWSSILDYWDYANSDMPLYSGVLPDGLPQDDSLCIVVLGYALASDGSMKKELVGRLETALASAQKYPNAYIVCTGGGTAKNDKTVTEAGQMAKWLAKQGIAKDRIIVEDQAMSTVGNANNTYKILTESYPGVTHLALVTSDYHLPRSCMLFYAKTLLAVDGETPLMSVAANGAYITGRAGSESISNQAENLSGLSKISISGLSKPKLSSLDHISVQGNLQFPAGTELALQVIAHYDTGLYREVSNQVNYAGIDLAAAGVQDVTVSYEENGRAVSTTVQIEMLPPETEPPTQPPTLAPTEAATAPATEAPTEPVPEIIIENPDRLWAIPAAIAVLLVIVEFFIIRQLLKNRKRRKAALAAAKEAELPDDNSPLEYI